MVKITECPRDAMQGIKEFIPTASKIHYLNLLLKVGFDRLDIGSFVSPKYTPQMRDTAEVLEGLEVENSSSELLTIIANVKGAEGAGNFPQVKYLGFPLSLSETFQQRNTNSSISEAYDRIAQINEISAKNGQALLVYLSMGFGNPYGDPWHAELISEHIHRLERLRISEIRLSDTTGESTAEKITAIFPAVRQRFPNINLGLHLHSKPQESRTKLEAALEAGCLQFDTAIGGFGGCPMASDTLTGNIATESLISLLKDTGRMDGLNQPAWEEARAYSAELFNTYV